jgi:hypothetical protein
MIGQFTESLGSRLGEKAAGVLTTAPVAYASAALALWLIDGDASAKWSRLTKWVSNQEPTQLLAWSVAGLLVVLAAASIVRQFAPAAIRVLEGYWSWPFGRLAEYLGNRAWDQRLDATKAMKRLAPAILAGTATTTEQSEYLAADALRARRPSQQAWSLPTRLGNTLRAAETRPLDKYALDPIKLWAVMWLVLPDSVRAELGAARSRLDTAAVGVVWCLLGVALAVVVWWAAPVAVAAAWCAYRFWVLPAGADYADLFEATFDAHRFDLYKALRIAVPQDSSAEHSTGRDLTDFVWRGRDDEAMRFAHSQADTGGGRGRQIRWRRTARGLRSRRDER